MPVIELTNINKYFGKDTARVHVLRNLNFQANRGELILILGPKYFPNHSRWITIS